MKNVFTRDWTTESLSARRVWNEIFPRYPFLDLRKSLSARRVWIEMSMPSGIVINPSASLSARRVCSEIEHLIVLLYPQYVTLREEGVD